MGEVASSYVSIVPKISDNFGKQLQTQMKGSAAGAFGPIDAEGKKAGEKSAKTFGGAFKGVVGPMLALASIGAITTFVGKTVADFSELQDATGAASVVFGDGMDLITAKAEKAAQVAGASKVAWLNGAITMGTFGKSAGLSGTALADFSNGLAQTAADMASFRGTSPEQAIEAVGAALRGETEPIRAYGVLLDDASMRQEALRMGLISTTSQALSPQNKVLAAQAMILKQTSDAQGDYARTADSAANVQKTLAAESANLSAEIGAKLAPAIVAAQSNGIKLIQWATDNQAALVPLAGTFGTVAAAIAGVVAVGKGVESLKSARDTVKGLGDAFQDMGTKAKIATVSAGAIGIALTAAAIVYSVFAQANADSKAKVEGFTQAIDADSGALGTNSRAYAANELAKSGALVAGQKLGLSADVVVSAALGEAGAVAQVAGAYDVYLKGVQAANRANPDKNAAMVDSQTAATNGADAYHTLTGAVGTTSTAVQQAMADQKLLTEATTGGTKATGTITAALVTNNAALKTNADALQKVIDKRLKLRGDKRSLEAAIDGATDSLKKNGKTLDIHTEKGRANQQALDDIATAGKAVGGNMDHSRTAFIKAATAMGLSKKAADKLATSLGLIKSKTVTVKVQFSQAEANFKIGLDYFGHKAAAGGAIYGPGSGTSDSIPALLSNGEHVLTAAEVRAMGGQSAVYRMRSAVRGGGMRFAAGGAVGPAAIGGRSLTVNNIGADAAELTARTQAAWRHDMAGMAVQS